MGPLRHGSHLRAKCLRPAEDPHSCRHFSVYLESLPDRSVALPNQHAWIGRDPNLQPPPGK